MHVLRVVVAVALVCSVAACTFTPEQEHPGSGTPGASGGGAQVFLAALGRIHAGAATRKTVRFSDNAALSGLGGEWKALAAAGLPEGYGISPTQARYAISAETVTVLAGGQDPARVQAALTAKGWTADGDRLVAPKQSADPGATVYPVVRAVGADVLIGGDAGSLDAVSQAESLAADPVLRSLADCLGGVVVARYAATASDTIAVGALRPGSDGTVHAVVCSAWPSPGAAAGAAAAQQQQYESFTSPIAGETPVAAHFNGVKVTVSGSVVRVDGVVAGPGVVLDAFDRQRLPYLRFS